MSHQQHPVAGARTPCRNIVREVLDGQAVVNVPLDHGRYAVLDAHDFERLSACGIRQPWSVFADEHGVEHVRAPSASPRRFPVLDVARLVTAASPIERVLFRSTDRLNPRRQNLVAVSRRTGRAVSA